MTKLAQKTENGRQDRINCVNQAPLASESSDLSDKIPYVHHPEFDDHESVHNILEAIPGTEPKTIADRRSRLDGSDYLLPNRPLLSREAERTLFLRMNLLKCMAVRRQHESLHGEMTQLCENAVRRLLDDANSTRNKIVEANQRLVVSNASKFSRSGVALADLIGEANLALMKAIDHFDIGRGFRLSTYATFAIRRHLSRYVQREQKRSPLSGEELNEPYIEEESAAWIDVHPGELVNEILAALPQRERMMVKMRFGLTDDGRAQTLDRIGQSFGISKERVRQLIQRSTSQAFGQHAQRLGLD